MKTSSPKPVSVVILDFASEKNRGDAAMQVSILSLSKQHFPEAQIDVVTVFGANQHPACLSEFDHTYDTASSVTFRGGLVRTYEQLIAGDAPANQWQRLRALLQIAFVTLAVLLRMPHAWRRRLVMASARPTFDCLLKADYIVWNGRNFRGFSYWKEPLALYTLCAQPLLCAALGKPMVCLGASVWELKNPLSRLLIECTFSACRLVTLREPKSFAYVQETYPDLAHQKRFVLVPDLSLPMLQSIAQSLPSLPKSDTVTIAITIVGRREVGSEEAYLSYIEAVRLLVTHVNKTLQAHILVVPQVTFAPEANEEAVSKAMSILPDDAYTILTSDMSVQELVATYKQVDMLIASRMHSAIFAATVGTPVLALSYDSGSKWHILSDMGLPHSAVISIQTVADTDVIAAFDAIWNERAALMEHVAQTLEKQLYPTATAQFTAAREALQSPHV